MCCGSPKEPVFLSGFLAQVQSVWVCTCPVFDAVFSVRGPALAALHAWPAPVPQSLWERIARGFSNYRGNSAVQLQKLLSFIPFLMGQGGPEQRETGQPRKKITLKMKNI